MRREMNFLSDKQCIPQMHRIRKSKISYRCIKMSFNSETKKQKYYKYILTVYASVLSVCICLKNLFIKYYGDFYMQICFIFAFTKR